MKDKLIHWLGDRTFLTSMLRLALPIALQNLLASSLALIDTVMVGGLGEAPLASVALAGQWIVLMNLVLVGVSSGAAVFVAQFWGKEDMSGIRKVYGLAMISAITTAIIFGLVGFVFPRQVMSLYTNDTQAINVGAQYLRIVAVAYVFFAINSPTNMLLRSTESVKIPFICSGIAVASNTLMNWILIYGKFGLPALGVQGAAIATVISAGINTILLLAMSWRKSTAIHASYKQFLSFDRRFALEFFKVSIPVMLNEASWAIGSSIMNAILGRMGTVNYSAYAIASSAMNLILVFFIGINSACAVMVGKRIGVGDIRGGYLDAKRFLAWTVLMGVVLGSLLISSRDLVLMLFKITPEGIVVARNVIFVCSSFLPLSMMIYVTISGVFRSGGDTKTGFMMDTVCIYGFSIPFIALAAFVLKWPFIFIYVLTLVDNFIKLVWGMIHFTRAKWIRPVTEEGKDALVQFKEQRVED